MPNRPNLSSIVLDKSDVGGGQIMWFWELTDQSGKSLHKGAASTPELAFLNALVTFDTLQKEINDGS